LYPPRRDDPRADLHQADVQLGAGDDAAGMHGHLGPPASANPRERPRPAWEVAHAHVNILPLFDHLLKLCPHATLGRHHHQEQVGAGAELLGFVADHQAFEIGFGAVQASVDHGHDVLVEDIQLGVEFYAGNPIPQVDQRGARVLGDDLAGYLAVPSMTIPGVRSIISYAPLAGL